MKRFVRHGHLNALNLISFYRDIYNSQLIGWSQRPPVEVFTTSPYFSQVFDTINPLIKIAKLGDSSLNESGRAIDKIRTDLESLLQDFTSVRYSTHDEEMIKSNGAAGCRVNRLSSLINQKEP